MVTAFLGRCFVLISVAGSAVAAAQEASAPASPPQEAPAPAPSPTPAPEQEKATLHEGPDSVKSQLEESKKKRLLLFESIVEPWLEANDWLDKTIGLRMGFSYAMLGQWATEAAGSSSAGGGMVEIIGEWNLWGRKKGGDPGSIGFGLRYRFQAGGLAPLDLNDSIGSITDTSASFGKTKGLEVRQAYFDQTFFSGRLGFRLGRFLPDDLFDVYELKSTKLYFLNSAFSDNPAVAFPSSGNGAVVHVTPLEDFHLLGGVFNTDGRLLEDSSATSTEDLFTALQASWTPDYGPFGKASHLVMYWHTNSTSSGKPEGNGLTYSFEQTFPSGLTAFFRVAYSATTATSVQTLLSAGAGMDHPFGRPGTYGGVALAAARPSDPNLRSEEVVEAFYRVGLSPYLQVTGDVEIIIHPARNPAVGAVAVFSARGRVKF